MRRTQRTTITGDTMIEVMIAVTIFSLVAVGAMILMNRGLSMAQRSLETTLVRQQIDSQAEMLRYVHSMSKHTESAYPKLWNDLPKADSISQILDVSRCPNSIPTNGFALMPTAHGNKLSVTTDYNSSPDTYAKLSNGIAQGLSVQLIKVQGGNAYDAYVQACWNSVGNEKPMTLGTIVRLYDPGAVNNG